MASVRPLLAAIGLSAFALAGCATDRPSRTMSWGVSETPDEGLKLVLGVPETDDVAVMMVCRPRSGRVDVMIVGRASDPAVLELRSGKLSARYSGVAEPDEASIGAYDIAFKADATDPVLARFADTGELAIVLPTRRIALPNGFASAHDFLRRCRAPA